MAKITKRFLDGVKSGPKVRFERDDALIGFGVKVYPSGRIAFIAEGRIKGAGTKRVTIGTYPVLSLEQARTEARKIISDMQMGNDPSAVREAALRARRSLSEVFEDYMSGKDRKPRTVKDYKGCFQLVFSDWGKRPITSITKADVEKRFRRVKDERGERTANKAFAILSGVCEWAIADDTLTENPCKILKQKGLRKASKRKRSYLSDDDIHMLLDLLYFESRSIDPKKKDLQREMKAYGITHQGSNYIRFLLFTGLRKSEALQLKWDDINWDKAYLTIHDTKNGREHFVPLSSFALGCLRGQQKTTEQRSSPYVFPSRYDDDKHMTEPKSQLAAICKATGLSFTLHDLRRTFATHASALGAPHDMIKRALNHKSGDVTEGYILTQIDAIRPVFEKVNNGFFDYAFPGERLELELEEGLYKG